MRGFTLIETVVVVALLAVLAGFSVPVYRTLQQRNDLQNTEFVVVSALRRTQLLAQAAYHDADWGTHIENSIVTIFEGNDFNTRVVSSDETFMISSHISVSGLTDVVFNKVSGLPIQTGQITLTGGANTVKDITIDEKGFIHY